MKWSIFDEKSRAPGNPVVLWIPEKAVLFFIIYRITCFLFRGFLWIHWPCQFAISYMATWSLFEPLWKPCSKRKAIPKQLCASQMHGGGYQHFVLLLASWRATGDGCPRHYFPLSANSCYNTTPFCFCFTVVYKLPHASSPEHISVVFTVAVGRRGRPSVAERGLNLIWIPRNDSSNVVLSLGFQRRLIRVDLPAEMVSQEALRDHPSPRREEFVRVCRDAAYGHRWVTAAWARHLMPAEGIWPRHHETIVSDDVCFARQRNRLCDVLIKRAASAVVKYTSVLSPM